MNNQNLTFAQYREQIDLWTKRVNAAGVVMADNKPVPVTFWKTFLGLKRTPHQELYNGVSRNKSGMVPAYVCKSIYFANLLSPDVFIEQVKLAIPQFEADKAS